MCHIASKARGEGLMWKDLKSLKQEKAVKTAEHMQVQSE